MQNKDKKFNFAPKIGWRALAESEPATSFSNWRCVFEKIRTDFINGLGGRKGKDRTPLPPASPKSGSGKANCQKTGKNVGSNFILARSGLFIILFSLLNFNLFVIIILKVELVNTTITYYQIIENMARENNIGENIKKYRTKQGLSQEDFAQKSGVKYTTLTKIESGVIKKPSVLVMAKIAKALGVNIEELIK